MSEPTPALPNSTLEYYAPVHVFVPRPKQRYWLHGILLLATIFTTLSVGSSMQRNFDKGLSPFAVEENDIPFVAPFKAVLQHPAWLVLGIPFSASLMLILLAHEMGHYFYCVRYGVHATLPFFIPFPSLIGTMGAFIRIRSPIRSRQALFDIGIAGPIAGFVVACGVLAMSLGRSRGVPLGAGPQELAKIHYPLIFQLTHRVVTSLGLVHGYASVPLDKAYLHPTAIAAWVGMFATSLNLLPGGQLDGGHIVFSIAPGLHRVVSRLTILILIPMAVYLWVGWLVWAILLEISSFRHPQVAEWPKVSGVRTGLAVFGLIMLVLTLTPAPFANSSLRELMHVMRGH